MKTRLFSAMLALALPLCAQDASAETEAVFYKAFYLEKGARDFAGAMNLYTKFLAAAPEHKLARQAAKQQFGLLNRTGKTKERDAFRTKYASLLGNTATGGRTRRAAGDAPAGGRGAGRGEGGERGGRGQRGAGGRGERMDPAARLADLEKRLAEAKESGDETQVERLTRQLERAKQAGERGGRREGGEAGGRGQGGRRGGRGGLFGGKKLADMNDEEMAGFKDGLERMSGMLDRMKERLGEEQAKALETNMEALNKALEGNKLEDAQKALDKIRSSFGRGRRGGGGGGR